MRPALTFEYEKPYWQQGIQYVAGIDEVGMGALAGPVVAAAVVFEPKTPLAPLVRGDGTKGGFSLVRDSKTLSAKQRDQATIWIKEQALTWAIGEASVEEITQLNIRGASHLAMRRAIDALAKTPELLLIDGTPVQPHPDIPATNIVDGDAFVFSIAAASILAKVYRDGLMAALDAEYPQYGWGSNKGYGSRLHLLALDSHGVTPHHRATYAPVARLLTK